MESALLVTVEVFSPNAILSARDQADELRELALSAGAEIVDEVFCSRDTITPNYYIGKGKLHEIKEPPSHQDVIDKMSPTTIAILVFLIFAVAAIITAISIIP